MHIALFILISYILASAAAPIKVAFIGDSITTGAGAEVRNKNGRFSKAS